MKYYLAIDFGASSACCILGHIEDNVLHTEEIHRFVTGFVTKGNRKVWEINRFFENIVFALKKCAQIGKLPDYVAIDTWGVDFVLLDENDELIMDAVSYRDSRTDGIIEEVSKIVSEEELYSKTGIQKQKFNTIYQLMALKKTNPDELMKARSMMMLPDYFNYLLTGQKYQEYTNATTTGLINANTKDWEWELIEKLELPRRIFLPIKAPGQIIGTVSDSINKIIGYKPEVIMAAGHDTASAIMAVPSIEEDILYISSGTWSLLGTEIKEPICTSESYKENFTNEGGFEYRFRYLKNIMGLWMLQSIKKEIADNMSFPIIAELASESSIQTIIDVNDERFLAPDSMKKQIDDYCRENSLEIPVSVGDYAKVIYDSLGECYRNAIEKIERLTGKKFKKINIIGGGSNAEYLNEVTARKTGKTVISGPSEGTAYGNILAMLKATAEIRDLTAGRILIANSVVLKEYSGN